ncbi:GNAT family N-acetyltransferase [Paucibacter sp. PLA-PC-4]|nr:GNAT family N-acetyltransferase [Paucibacter sp. PLA-PC-4]
MSSQSPKAMHPFEYSPVAPTPDAFKTLYDTTGWGPTSREASYYAGALAGSWCVQAAYCDGQLVGFARVISDGHLHAFITEMIVHPGYQRRGVGAHMLSSLLAACHEAGISDIQLLSARGKAAFYQRHGFVPRPQEGPGMQFVAALCG